MGSALKTESLPNQQYVGKSEAGRRPSCRRTASETALEDKGRQNVEVESQRVVYLFLLEQTRAVSRGEQALLSRKDAN